MGFFLCVLFATLRYSIEPYEKNDFYTGGGIYCPSVRPKIFYVSFLSATIDGRNLIFGHKLHIGIPYRGKCCWARHIPTSCLPTWLVFIHIEHMQGYHKWALAHSSSCFLRNISMNPKTVQIVIWLSLLQSLYFFMWIGNPSWPLPQDVTLFNIGPYRNMNEFKFCSQKPQTCLNP